MPSYLEGTLNTSSTTTRARASDIEPIRSTFQASVVPAIPVASLVPMHREDLLKPTDPNAPPLSDDEVKAAREAGLINKSLVGAQFNSFRRMRQARHYKEVNGQRFAVLSWVPSVKATADEDNCMGLMRIAGCFSTQTEADKHAENLLRGDSTRSFLITYVGLDFPLTTDEFGVLRKDEIDLDTKADEIDRAAKRAAEMVEEEKAREIEDARARLLDDVTRKRTADDLDSYIELCVKQAQSEAERERAMDQIAKCNRVVVATQPLLDHIIQLHPEYRETAAKQYELACQRVGLRADQSAMAGYLDFGRLESHKAIDAPERPKFEARDGVLVPVQSTDRVEEVTQSTDGVTQSPDRVEEVTQ
jgi:hypothetical protein